MAMAKDFLITPPDYYEDRLMVVLAEVEAHPGYWTAALCRYLNGLTQNWQECPPPTPQWEVSYHPPTAADQEHVLAQVRYCGRCADYMNQRKRYRAAQLPDPLLYTNNIV